MRHIHLFHKPDLIAPKDLRIKDRRVMRGKDYLSVVLVDF